MAYIHITAKEISDMVRKYAKGKTIRWISDETGHDRKTVRKYVRSVEAQADLKDKDAVKLAVKAVLPKKPGRPKKEE